MDYRPISKALLPQGHNLYGQIHNRTAYHANGKALDTQVELGCQNQSQYNNRNVVENGTDCRNGKPLVGLQNALGYTGQTHEEALTEHNSCEKHRKPEGFSCIGHQKIHQLRSKNLSQNTKNGCKKCHQIQNGAGHFRTLFILPLGQIAAEYRYKCGA